MSITTITTDPLAGLNPEQRRAAEAVRGPVRILAGAGTGKTRTVVHRIANQIATGVVTADQVLAVTFTDRAAGELRHRLSGLGVDHPVRAATFHSAAWAQLRHFWGHLDDGPLPDVLTSKVATLAGAARRAGAEPADLAAEVEWAQARRLTPDTYAADAGDDPDRGAGLTPTAFAEVWARYEAAKARDHLIDYGDMLLRCERLIASDVEVAATVRDRYRAITVDEFQDVNAAQHALLRAWLGDGHEVCVVGDDDQTIYSFTGAEARHLIDFPRHHPATTTVSLTRSYRSTPQVLAVANRILRAPGSRRTKELTPTLGDGPDPTFVAAEDADAEVAQLVAWVRDLQRAGTPLAEIAVIYRINAQSEAYETGLGDAGIPAVVRGEQGFFDRREVRQAVQALSSAAALDPAGDTLLAHDPSDPAHTTTRAASAPDPAKVAARVLRDRLSHDRRRQPPGRAAIERWRNVEGLLDLIDELDAPDIGTAVAELERRSALGADDAVAAISLLTYHKAKGLEFDAVALVAVEEGLLPFSKADTDAEVAEERRLLYVGATRARTHLRISWARNRTGRNDRRLTKRPSRFLYGIGPGAPQTSTKGRSDQPGSASRGQTAAGATGRVCRCGALLVGPAERAAGACGRCRGAAPGADDLDEAGRRRAERLREWRRRRAQETEKPAFTIFKDTTLVALAARRPTTREELLAVRGIGPAKVEAFGDQLLAILDDAGDPTS